MEGAIPMAAQRWGQRARVWLQQTCPEGAWLPLSMVIKPSAHSIHPGLGACICQDSLLLQPPLGTWQGQAVL